MPGKFESLKINLDAQAIGQRIKFFRNALGITIADLSRKAGLSIGMISETETGKNKPSPNLMLALLEFYHLNLNWLLTGEGEMLVSDSPPALPEKKEYGYLDEEVQQLLWHLEHTMVVRLAVVGFFLEYLYQNEELIKRETGKWDAGRDSREARKAG